MSLKARLGRLERATRHQRESEELKDLFLSGVAQIKALANGEQPPPLHPLANDSRFQGSFLAGSHRIVGGGTIGDSASESREAMQERGDFREVAEKARGIGA